MGVNGNESHFIVRRDSDDEMIVAACTTDGTSFVLSLDDTNFTPFASPFLAHMTSNFQGTVFTVHDHGISNRILHPSVFPRAARREHGVVLYSTNILGRVPNAMNIVTPKFGRIDEEPDEGGDAAEGKAAEEEEEAKSAKASKKSKKKKKKAVKRVEVAGALQKQYNKKKVRGICVRCASIVGWWVLGTCVVLYVACVRVFCVCVCVLPIWRVHNCAPRTDAVWCVYPSLSCFPLAVCRVSTRLVRQHSPLRDTEAEVEQGA